MAWLSCSASASSSPTRVSSAPPLKAAGRIKCIYHLKHAGHQDQSEGHAGYVIIIITLAAVRTAEDPTSQHNFQARPTRRGSASQAGAWTTEGCLARSLASAKDRGLSVFASQRQQASRKTK